MSGRAGGRVVGGLKHHLFFLPQGVAVIFSGRYLGNPWSGLGVLPDGTFAHMTTRNPARMVAMQVWGVCFFSLSLFLPFSF